MADDYTKDLSIVGLSGGEKCIAISWCGRLNGPYPGFGTVMFYFDEKGLLSCNNEYMSREFTLALIDLLKGAWLAT
jgi:hypothetical protein